jgi:hypothetical protein
MGYINLIYQLLCLNFINKSVNFITLLLEVEECEKQLDTTYTSAFRKCLKVMGLKLTASAMVDLWDEKS